MSNDPSIPKPDDSEIVDSHEALLHESSATREGSESLSPKLVILFVALAFLGAGYLVWNSGGFKSTVFNPARVAWDGAGTGGAAAVVDPMVLGKKVFTQNCAVCHQANGQGVPGQFPPLAGSEWVLAKEGWHGDNHIVKIVINGLQGVVQVKGQNFNNVMAPWGKVLKDEQIAAVLTYVRNEWGNQAPPITTDFVAKVREKNKDRVDPWTQKELQAVGRELVGEAAAAPAPETTAPAPAAQPGT